MTASDSGDTAYGNIRKSFDTLPEDCDRNQADAVVLPSEIECTHPPWTKFSSKATEVTCMWIASPAISCTFQVTRGAIPVDCVCFSAQSGSFLQSAAAACHLQLFTMGSARCATFEVHATMHLQGTRAYSRHARMCRSRLQLAKDLDVRREYPRRRGNVSLAPVRAGDQGEGE